MNFIPQLIPELILIEPLIHKDNRGYFVETFKQELFDDAIGYKVDFIQDNESKSKKGVIRGLHFQSPPYEQTKLVRCVSGNILDVAVDLRTNSKTYGKSFSVELSSINNKQLLVPKGFAHGFQVISDEAIVNYKVDEYYYPDSDCGIIWNDPHLNIDWKINKDEIVISEKDTKLPAFNNFLSPFE